VSGPAARRQPTQVRRIPLIPLRLRLLGSCLGIYLVRVGGFGGELLGDLLFLFDLEFGDNFLDGLRNDLFGDGRFDEFLDGGLDDGFGVTGFDLGDQRAVREAEEATLLGFDPLAFGVAGLFVGELRFTLDVDAPAGETRGERSALPCRSPG
jgi:hypothetical protein